MVKLNAIKTWWVRQITSIIRIAIIIKTLHLVAPLKESENRHASEPILFNSDHGESNQKLITDIDNIFFQ